MFLVVPGTVLIAVLNFISLDPEAWGDIIAGNFFLAKAPEVPTDLGLAFFVSFTPWETCTEFLKLP